MHAMEKFRDGMSRLSRCLRTNLMSKFNVFPATNLTLTQILVSKLMKISWH